MSWSVAVEGRPAAVLEAARRALTRPSRYASEAIVQEKVLSVITEILVSAPENMVYKLEAFGTQKEEIRGKNVNAATVSLAPVWGWVE